MLSISASCRDKGADKHQHRPPPTPAYIVIQTADAITKGWAFTRRNPWIFTAPRWRQHPHFTNGKLKAQRRLITCPKSHSDPVPGLGVDPSAWALTCHLSCATRRTVRDKHLRAADDRAATKCQGLPLWSHLSFMKSRDVSFKCMCFQTHKRGLQNSAVSPLYL